MIVLYISLLLKIICGSVVDRVLYSFVGVHYGDERAAGVLR